MHSDRPSRSSGATPHEATQSTNIFARNPESASEHIRNALTIIAGATVIGGPRDIAVLLPDELAALIRRLHLALGIIEQPMVLIGEPLSRFIESLASRLNGNGDDEIREDVATVIGVLKAARKGLVPADEAIETALRQFGPGYLPEAAQTAQQREIELHRPGWQARTLAKLSPDGLEGLTP
jgi:hypothetical protein